MELKLYINDVELDLQDNKFEINIQSFNPLTWEDASRKYTSSIKIERSAKNDSVFFAYRYPELLPKEALTAKAYISGIFVDEFRVNVVVTEEGYELNLLPLSPSLNDGQPLTLSNNRFMSYFDKVNGVIDVKKLILYHYPNFVDTTNVVYPLAIVPEREDIEFPLELDLLPFEYAYNYNTGEWSNFDGRLKTSSESFNRFLADPDWGASFKFTASGDITIFGPFVNSSFQVKLRIMGDYVYKMLTFKELLPGGTGGKYTIPEFGLDTTQPVQFEIVTINPTVKFESNIKLTVTGYDNIAPVSINYNIGVTTKYDLLKGFAILNGCKIERSGSNIIKTEVVTPLEVDWSDRFVSMESIKEASGAGCVKSIMLGETEYIMAQQPWVSSDKSTLEQIYPYNTKGEFPTVAVKTSESGQLIFNYFSGTDYYNHIKNKFKEFEDMTEYECVMNLSIFDVTGFNSSYRVWIESLRSYFYVLSISGWSTKSGNCKVKLLKLK